MFNIAFGILLILHGLVHLFYFAQNNGCFELKPGMKWPRESWLLSGLSAHNTIKIIAGSACIAITAGFMTGALAFFFEQSWWKYCIVYTAILSSAMFIVFWNGKLKKLADQGWIGILINILAILVTEYLTKGAVS
jgi:ABC-type dipeptide/oligopeptide/nickel transport system permease component